ncbi:hypothetical protein ABK040_002898 [Willaertia magna]
MEGNPYSLSLLDEELCNNETRMVECNDNEVLLDEKEMEELKHNLMLKAIFCEYHLKRGNISDMSEEFNCNSNTIIDIWHKISNNNSITIQLSILIIIKGLLIIDPNCLQKEELKEICIQLFIQNLINNNLFATTEGNSIFEFNNLNRNKTNVRHQAVADASTTLNNEKKEKLLQLGIELLFVHFYHKRIEEFLIYFREYLRNKLNNENIEDNSIEIIIYGKLLLELLNIIINEIYKNEETSTNMVIDSIVIKEWIQTIMNFNMKEKSFNDILIINKEFWNDNEMFKEEDSTVDSTITFIHIFHELLQSENVNEKILAIQCLGRISLLNEEYAFKLYPLFERILFMEDDFKIRNLIVIILWELVFIFPAIQNYSIVVGMDDNIMEERDDDGLCGGVSLIEMLCGLRNLNKQVQSISILGMIRLLQKDLIVNRQVSERMLNLLKKEKENSTTIQLDKQVKILLDCFLEKEVAK